jgi:hypothetical protein
VLPDEYFGLLYKPLLQATVVVVLVLEDNLPKIRPAADTCTLGRRKLNCKTIIDICSVSSMNKGHGTGVNLYENIHRTTSSRARRESTTKFVIACYLFSLGVIMAKVTK